MLVNKLSKALSAALCGLLTVVLLGLSIAQPFDDSSSVSAAGSKNDGIWSAARVRTSMARKARKTPTKASPFLAQAAPIAEPKLLAAVSNSDITTHHQELADATLRAIPSPCRDHLNNFYVRYINPTSRGLGGKSTIILDGTVPDTEFVALLVHECGHVTHANMQGSWSAGKSGFRDGNDMFYKDSPAAAFFAISWSTENILRAKATKQDFVSGYAQSDAFEDFAETFAMYILHRPAFEERAKTNAAIAAKLQWMKKHLPVDENSLGASQYSWDKKVPWDVTKLAYSLALGN